MSKYLPDPTQTQSLTLSEYYQPPIALSPLENDVMKTGVPSDHKIVYMKPLALIEPKKKIKKMITFRPLTECGLEKFGTWLRAQTWESITEVVTGNEKASNLQKLLLEGLDLHLPEKTICVSSDDQPWYNESLKKLSRKIKREYVRHKKSDRWQAMRKTYNEKCAKARVSNYQNIVEDLKTSRPNQWYSKLKDLPNQIQAETIADEFSAISN